MEAAGEATWTNATHLMVADPQHPRYGSFVRGADLGWPKPEGQICCRTGRRGRCQTAGGVSGSTSTSCNQWTAAWCRTRGRSRPS